MSKISDNKNSVSMHPNIDKVKQGKKLKVMQKKKTTGKKRESSIKKSSGSTQLPVDSRSSKRDNKHSIVFNKKMIKIKKGELTRSADKDFQQAEAERGT